MKTCSLIDFMVEIKPWLDTDHIRSAELDQHDNFVLHFMDGMKNVYKITDCNEAQIKGVIKDLKSKGIRIEE